MYYVGHHYYILQHDFLCAIGDFWPNLIVFLSILFPTWWYIWVAKSSNRLCTFSDVRADVSLKLKPFSFAYSELSAWRTRKIKDVTYIQYSDELSLFSIQMYPDLRLLVFRYWNSKDYSWESYLACVHLDHICYQLALQYICHSAKKEMLGSFNSVFSFSI